MGIHATVASALVALLEGGSLGIPILNALAMTEVQSERYAEFVAIVRTRIDYESHTEINPTPGNGTQMEHWEWEVYVKGGGGAVDLPAKGTKVDSLLESVRAILDARRLDSTCGPLSLVSEEYQEVHGTGVLYVQRWRHTRLEG